MNVPWHADDSTGGAGFVRPIKFTPSSRVVNPEDEDPAPVAYTYVSECSNRGVCDTDAGLCDCFPGFTGHDCSFMNALAV